MDKILLGSDGMEPAIETEQLTKAFGDTRAVDGVDLLVPRGCVYGLLGPNGAGKTTAVRILATLLRPDGGRARVLGHDVVAEPGQVRARVSLTGQFASVDGDLTVRENLVLLARLLGHSHAGARRRSDELLEAFSLAQAASRGTAQLSGGMRRRLDIAASIIVTPDLLFLDEPTTGLDPRSRAQLWQLVHAIVAAGTTVLLTTQYLDEADRLADRIAVLDRGRVVAEGTTDELKASVGAGGLRVRLADAGRRDEARRVLVDRLETAVHAESDPAMLTARLDGDAGQRGARAAAALGDLVGAGIAVSDFAVGQPSLDEVFLALTGSRPGEEQEVAA